MNHLRAFILLLLPTYCYTQQRVFIIIPGTWASDSSWSKPGGDFFNALEERAQQLGFIAVPYTWSGALSHAQRVAAGKGLARLIASYPSDTLFYLAAHSHGGNVAMIASQELPHLSNAHKIHVLYTLATPIDPDQYAPNMRSINYLYNIFSFNDFVQPILGLYHRTYPTQERVANIRIFINDEEPHHCTIQDQALACALPDLHDYLTQYHGGSIFEHPGIVRIHTNEMPSFKIDICHDALLKKDENIHQVMFALFKKQCIEKELD